MKISTQEVERIKRIRSADSVAKEALKPAVTHIMDSRTAPDMVNQVASIVDSTPDVREEVIEAIKAQTATGNYRVSSEDVAELILRRALADRVR